MTKINLLKKKNDTQDKSERIVKVFEPVFYTEDFCPVEEFCEVFNLEEENNGNNG